MKTPEEQIPENYYETKLTVDLMIEKKALQKEIQELQMKFDELSDMFILSLEVGKDTQNAYNMMIMSGCKVPSSIAQVLNSLNASTQQKTRRINQYTDRLKMNLK